MSKFVDRTGAEWKVVLDVGLTQQVKDDLGINLSVNKKDTSWFEAILLDHSTLVDILHIICQDEVKERGLTPRDFGRRFTEEVLEVAGDALLECVVCFGRRSRLGTHIRDQLPQMMRKAEDAAIAEFKKQMEKQEKTATDSNSPTDSPAYAG